MWPRCAPAGEQGLYLYFGEEIREDLSRRVQAAATRLLERPPAGLREVVPSYVALLVLYDPLQTDYDRMAAAARAAAATVPAGPAGSRLFRIPVAYGGSFGPDLDDVARHHGLTPEEVVRIHAAGDYYVHFTGFTPGFPFLGGLSPRIATPRLPTPRTRVPAGSVGIAGAQTGVYPVESPGGWRLIGRTPVPLFRLDARPPVVLEPGSRVRFVPVGSERYRRVAAAVRAGTYRVEGFRRDDG